MNISLTPRLEAYVKTKVESGFYNNASEVVREALRFVNTHEEWVREMEVSQLRQQLEQGVSQLDNNQSQEIHTRHALTEMFASLRDEA